MAEDLDGTVRPGEPAEGSEPIETPAASDGSDQSDVTPQPAPVAPPAQVQTPPGGPKYGGKSPEEMARLLEEKDRFISEQAQISAQARHDAEFFRTLSEQSGGVRTPIPAPMSPQAPQPQTPVTPMGLPFDPSQIVTEAEFIQNPVAASAKIAMAMREYDRQMDAQRQAYTAAESAKRNFVTGRKAAMDATPGLFEGLENQVSESVAQAYRDKLLSPDQLLEPKTWQLAAQMVRWERGEYDLGRYYKPAQPPNPVAPGFQQTPSARQAASGQTTLTPEQREMVRMWGKDEATFLKAYEKELGNA